LAHFLLLLLLKLLLLLLLLLLGDGGAEVDLLGHQPHVHPLLLPVAQTLPDEIFRLSGDGGPVGELNLGGLQQGTWGSNFDPSRLLINISSCLQQGFGSGTALYQHF